MPTQTELFDLSDELSVEECYRQITHHQLAIQDLRKCISDKLDGLERLVSDETTVILSARESQVSRYLATNLTWSEVGQAMFLSTNTIKTHVKNLYAKLGVNNRRDAIIALGELAKQKRAEDADA